VSIRLSSYGLPSMKNVLPSAVSLKTRVRRPVIRTGQAVRRLRQGVDILGWPPETASQVWSNCDSVAALDLWAGDRGLQEMKRSGLSS
jgi:hypothetical protein